MRRVEVLVTVRLSDGRSFQMAQTWLVEDDVAVEDVVHDVRVTTVDGGGAVGVGG